MNQELLNINEAAALARVSRRTVYNWLQADKLEYVRTAGGAVRIVRSSLFRQDATWSAHVAPVTTETVEQ